MSLKLNKTDNSIETYSLINSETFLQLKPHIQSEIVGGIKAGEDSKTKGGLLGRLLGVSTHNASIHVSFIICLLFFLLIVLVLSHSYCTGEDANMDLIGVLVSVVTLGLGYVFGKGSQQ